MDEGVRFSGIGFIVCWFPPTCTGTSHAARISEGEATEYLVAEICSLLADAAAD
jgi:hypothetical protein